MAHRPLSTCSRCFVTKSYSCDIIAKIGKSAFDDVPYFVTTYPEHIDCLFSACVAESTPAVSAELLKTDKISTESFIQAFMATILYNRPQFINVLFDGMLEHEKRAGLKNMHPIEHIIAVADLYQFTPIAAKIVEYGITRPVQWLSQVIHGLMVVSVQTKGSRKFVDAIIDELRCHEKMYESISGALYHSYGKYVQNVPDRRSYTGVIQWIHDSRSIHTKLEVIFTTCCIAGFYEVCDWLARREQIYMCCECGGLPLSHVEYIRGQLPHCDEYLIEWGRHQEFPFGRSIRSKLAKAKLHKQRKTKTLK